MATLLERISQIAQNEGITIGALERAIGASKGVLSRAIQNDTDIQAKWLTKLVENYPQYSADWLLSGVGDITKVVKGLDNDENRNHRRVLSKGNKCRTVDFVSSERRRALRKIPLYDLSATAGFSALYRDFSSADADYITIPNLPPVDGAIYARGDSMSPLIASGDIIIFKKVELNPGNILWGNIYIVSYVIDGDDYTVLKYVRQSGKAGHIRLESFNPRYDPQEIPASCVTAMALVKASITFHTIA